MQRAARWWGLGGSCAPGPAGGLACCGLLPGRDALKLLVLAMVQGPDWLVYLAAAVGVRGSCCLVLEA